MRAIIQRVSQASVSIGGKLHSEIGTGLLIFLGVAPGDTDSDLQWLSQKIARLRIFSDDAGKMNLSIIDISGSALVVSQFTLFADCKKGNRPAFTGAAAADKAETMYQQFLGQMKALIDGVEAGVFAADMDVALHNDGPVTISLDSNQR